MGGVWYQVCFFSGFTKTRDSLLMRDSRRYAALILAKRELKRAMRL